MVKPDGRLALIFSDGSVTILDPFFDLDKARKERDEADENQTDRKLLTKIARVNVEILEMLDNPPARSLTPWGDDR